MEIDEVVVPSEVWKKIVAGDRAAARELGTSLKGIETYMHILHWNPETEEVHTLRELEQYGVIDFVTLGGPFTPGTVQMRNEQGKEITLHVRDNLER